MKQRELEKIANALLGPRLITMGFAIFGRAFSRTIPSGVIHTILYGLDTRSNHSFQMLCGLNATVLCDTQSPHQAGVLGGRHLTLDGWSVNSGRWACHNEETAIASLESIRALIDDLVEPWFQYNVSLTSVADVIRVNELGLVKARLYYAAGCKDEAIAAVHQYLERLRSPTAWDSPAWLNSETDAATILLRELEYTPLNNRAK